MGNQDTRAPSNISKIQGGVYTYNKIGEPLKQEHHTVTVDSPTPMLAYGARFTDKTRPEPFRPRTAGCPHSPSFAPRSTPRHTSAAHLSLFSSLPFISARTRNSNARNNCDGGHLNSAECSGGTPPERTSKLERCAFLSFARAGSPDPTSRVRHLLAYGVVWATDQISTRAILSAASR